MTESYHNWYSPALGKGFEMLVFGESGFPLVLFPTSMGRYYENKDFQLIESASWFLDNGLVQIFCPDSIDSLSWYNKQVHPAVRVHNHIQYDHLLHKELVPSILEKTGYDRVALAGCSFGAYHAMNFGFRHPELVKYIFCMSGAFDIKGQLDGYYSDDVYFNNPVDFIPSANHPAFGDMHIILGTGEHDICLDANLKMAEILRNKHISHWLDVHSGANHDWPVWRSMFPHYLSMIR